MLVVICEDFRGICLMVDFSVTYIIEASHCVVLYCIALCHLPKILLFFYNLEVESLLHIFYVTTVKVVWCTAALWVFLLEIHLHSVIHIMQYLKLCLHYSCHCCNKRHTNVIVLKVPLNPSHSYHLLWLVCVDSQRIEYYSTALQKGYSKTLQNDNDR